MSEAFVTLVTNDDYAKGAAVLGQSLRSVQTTKKLVVMVTDTVSAQTRRQLTPVWDEVVDVAMLQSADVKNVTLMQRPELAITLTKIHAWRLVRLSKCVFLDADTLVIQNVDDLFQRPELSAAADVGWPDIFNSGVFVFVPSEATFQSLLRLAESEGSFDGGDQGLLNAHWPDWVSKSECRLPFTYNMTVSLSYTYAAAYQRFGKNAKILHFLGRLKPWHHSYDSSRDQVNLCADAGPADRAAVSFVHQWWKMYSTTEQTHSSMGGVGQAQTHESATPSDEQQKRGVYEADSRRRWEAGHPDYMGTDKYEQHIQTHLEKLALSPPKTP